MARYLSRPLDATQRDMSINTATSCVTRGHVGPCSAPNCPVLAFVQFQAMLTGLAAPLDTGDTAPDTLPTGSRPCADPPPPPSCSRSGVRRPSRPSGTYRKVNGCAMAPSRPGSWLSNLFRPWRVARALWALTGH